MNIYTCVLLDDIQKKRNKTWEAICDLMEVMDKEGSITIKQIKKYKEDIKGGEEVDKEEYDYEMDLINKALQFMEQYRIDVVCENYDR